MSERDGMGAQTHEPSLVFESGVELISGAYIAALDGGSLRIEAVKHLRDVWDRTRPCACTSIAMDHTCIPVDHRR